MSAKRPSSSMKGAFSRLQGEPRVVENVRIASPEQQRKANQLFTRLSKSVEKTGWKPYKPAG
ncbi:hypothetical protein [Roseomonas genomospecies 6]|uniref:hypothetical protein n=1 Tax=Roseomonas genomospecies 6 TaxID=214106 RepID=UPI0011F22218|nr:hypothetical protein [Roseomonas genomospecies 6]